MNLHSSFRTYGAVVLIALGVGFLLEQLGIVPFSYLLNQWWPVLVIGVGVVLLVRPDTDTFWPLALVAVGIILLLGKLGYTQVNLWSLFWPAVLLVVGVWLLTPHRERQDHRLGLERSVSSDKQVEIETFFSGQEQQVDTEDFAGGKVTTWFGATKLDLRKAKIDGQATLDVLVGFGGLEILVSEDCRVIIQGSPVFGGWEDKTIRPAESTQTLTLIGTCIFGGVSVKN